MSFHSPDGGQQSEGKKIIAEGSRNFSFFHFFFPWRGSGGGRDIDWKGMDSLGKERRVMQSSERHNNTSFWAVELSEERIGVRI